jgi:pimeloyl-ACP methyl ester carboxylesterase
MPQTLPATAIYTVESDDDHLISPPMRAALRDTLKPARCFRFRAASHFPYVTNPHDYTALLCEALGLAPHGTHWPTGPEAVI